jgi:hypothetical protein
VEREDGIVWLGQQELKEVVDIIFGEVGQGSLLRLPVIGTIIR